MLAVSLALAAVLFAGESGDDPAPPGPDAGARLPADPGATPTSTPASPGPTAVPAVPPELGARLEALPEKLRDETLLAYSRGTLGLPDLEQIVTQYENRNPSLRVGSVLGVTDGTLRLEVFTTGEQVEVTTSEQTLVRRGDTDIALEDLRVEELVMVESADGGNVALTIEALGVSAR